MHFLYIIYSPTADKYFVSETDNVPERIELHNSFKRLKSITGKPSDWTQKLIFECNSREEAVYLVKHIRKMKSRAFLEKVIAKPEILGEILSNR